MTTNKFNTRATTCKLLRLMDEGLISPTFLAEACLQYMSEAEVNDLVGIYDLFGDEDAPDEEGEAIAAEMREQEREEEEAAEDWKQEGRDLEDFDMHTKEATGGAE